MFGMGSLSSMVLIGMGHMNQSVLIYLAGVYRFAGESGHFFPRPLGSLIAIGINLRQRLGSSCKSHVDLMCLRSGHCASSLTASLPPFKSLADPPGGRTSVTRTPYTTYTVTLEICHLAQAAVAV